MIVYCRQHAGLNHFKSFFGEVVKHQATAPGSPGVARGLRRRACLGPFHFPALAGTHQSLLSKHTFDSKPLSKESRRIQKGEEGGEFVRSSFLFFSKAKTLGKTKQRKSRKRGAVEAGRRSSRKAEKGAVEAIRKKQSEGGKRSSRGDQKEAVGRKESQEAKLQPLKSARSSQPSTTSLLLLLLTTCSRRRRVAPPPVERP